MSSICHLLRSQSTSHPNEPILVYPVPDTNNSDGRQKIAIRFLILLLLVIAFVLFQVRREKSNEHGLGSLLGGDNMLNSLVVVLLLIVSVLLLLFSNQKDKSKMGHNGNSKNEADKEYQYITFEHFEKRSNYLAKQFDAVFNPKVSKVFVILQPSSDYGAFTITSFSLMKCRGKEAVFLLPNETGMKNYLYMARQLSSDCICLCQPSLHFLVLGIVRLFLSPLQPIRFKQTVFMISSDQSLVSRIVTHIYALIVGASILYDDGKSVLNQYELEDPKPDQPIVWTNTTGSTGVPKIVQITHGNLCNQVHSIADILDRHNQGKNVEKDKANTNDTGLGINYGTLQKVITHNYVMTMAIAAMAKTTLIPRGIDLKKVSQMDPTEVIKCMRRFQPTYAHGSPSVWIKLIQYALDHDQKLPACLKLFFCGGAPVPNRLHLELKKCSTNASLQLLTPYGATECLPMCCIGTHELIASKALEKTEQGYGVCVGKECYGVKITIDKSIFSESNYCDGRGIPDMGEIITTGAAVSPAYLINDEANRMHKITNQDGSISHRTGDVGYVDSAGKVWYCGRRTHCVVVDGTVVPSVNIEGIANSNPNVQQSAFAGTAKGPIIALQLYNNVPNDQESNIAQTVEQKILDCERWTFLRGYLKVLIFDRNQTFPVDPRHNSKIERLKVGDWAANKI